EFLLRISHGIETNQRPATGCDLGAATIARVDHQTGCQQATHLQLTIKCSGKASGYYELWLIESYDGFACSARSLSADSSAYQHSQTILEESEIPAFVLAVIDTPVLD